jgi:hypothetical protein
MTVVYLAFEDEPARAVGERLLREAIPDVEIGGPIGGRGNTYLKDRLGNFLKLCRTQALFLLTDLDHAECAPSLIADWVGEKPLPDRFLFRVAVRETEAWLMADHDGFAAFSGIPKSKLPHDVESLDDPKEALKTLVRRHGRKDLRASILPPPTARTARVSESYNPTLSAFIRDPNGWNPARAAENSDSLRRARDRLAALGTRTE